VRTFRWSPLGTILLALGAANYLGSSDERAAPAPDGMAVFGLGRGPDATSPLRGAGVRVTVGLLEIRPGAPGAHEAIAATVEAALASEPATVDRARDPEER
jgi:hypothetical protein